MLVGELVGRVDRMTATLSALAVRLNAELERLDLEAAGRAGPVVQLDDATSLALRPATSQES